MAQVPEFTDLTSCIKYVESKTALNTEQATRVAEALVEYRLQARLVAATDQEEIKRLKKDARKGTVRLSDLNAEERQGFANVLEGIERMEPGTVDVCTDLDLIEKFAEFAIDPDSVDNLEITEAFMIGEGNGEDSAKLVSSADLLSTWTRNTMVSRTSHGSISQKRAMMQEQRGDSNRLEVSKTATGTAQQQSELGHNKSDIGLSKVDIVEPPYPPELLAAFLETDDVHFRCVRTKVTDSVGRDYVIESAVTIKPDENSNRDKDGHPVKPKTVGAIPRGHFGGLDSASGDGLLGETGGTSLAFGEENRASVGHKKQTQKDASLPGNPEGFAGATQRRRVVSQDVVDDETQVVEDFIEDANEVLGFEGVLDRCAMDYEAIGWAAIEVIRSVDMKVRRIAHVPAVRVRALKGWKGFVEIISEDRADGSTVHRGKYVYYQPFGAKVVSKRRNPLTGQPEAYDPKIDGPLSASTAQWNMIDRETGEPTAKIERAANEIIWVPRHHSNTIYYGMTDVIPALGWVLANVHIRDYLLQFFEHNTVPRYAIIVEGAKMAKDVQNLITQYFSTHVKGKAHKTLIIPIPAMRGEVKIRFERLDADVKEGSFQETKKNNSQSTMTAHGVSPAIIGISDAAELGSGKGLSQAEIYKDRIITPSQKYWASKINRLLRMGLGVQSVRLRFNPLDIRDETAEQLVLTNYMIRGACTINEVRKRAGLGDPLIGGDRPFLLVGSVIMFVDEMTEAQGTERQKLEEQLEQMQTDMKISAAQNAAKVAAQGAAKPGANGKPKKPNTTSPDKPKSTPQSRSRVGSANKPTEARGQAK